MNMTQTPSFTRSPSRCGGKWDLGSLSHSRICSRFGLARTPNKSEPASWPIRSVSLARRISVPPKLTARDSQRRAAYLDALDFLRGTVRPGVQKRGASNFRPLADLNLLTELDPAVSCEMDRQWSSRGPGGRIFRNAVGWCKHPGLPTAS